MGGALTRPGYHCVLLGLDGSGKTTILNRIKFGRYTNTQPTIGFNCQKIQSNGRMFDLWDVGGLERTRPLWRSYTRNTDLIFFVLDSADSERLDEAKLELQSVIKLTEKLSVPIIVIANKQDLPSAVPLEKISQELGINKNVTTRALSLKSSCGITGEGLEQVLQEVKHTVQKRRTQKFSENQKFPIGGKIHRSISQHFL